MTSAKTTLNLPEILLHTARERAAAIGTDMTGLIVRALHEYLAQDDISARNIHDSAKTHSNGVTCAICGKREVTRFTIVIEEPMITVCAPYCPDNNGPVDAHGYSLHVGDNVIVYMATTGELVRAEIIQLGMDALWNSVAIIQSPGDKRTYQHACRRLRRADTAPAARARDAGRARLARHRRAERRAQ
jgi:hypothetical protein